MSAPILTNLMWKGSDLTKLTFTERDPRRVACVYADGKPKSFVEVHSAEIGGLPNCGSAIGIDPGRNFGITLLNGHFGITLWGKLPEETSQEYGTMAYLMTNELLDLYSLLPLDMTHAIVEGASYGDPYGQVGLAYIRESFYLALRHRGITVRMAAPMTIRKAVFGKGKIMADQVWTTLNHNAADSVAMALHAAEAHDVIL